MTRDINQEQLKDYRQSYLDKILSVKDTTGNEFDRLMINLYLGGALKCLSEYSQQNGIYLIDKAIEYLKTYRDYEIGKPQHSNF